MWAWVLVAAFLVLCWCVGISPNSDPDDVLKLLKIRAYLETGSWFDRSVPGVLQPGPFVSHWPRLLDLPYAALATWLLAPFAGRSAALAVAALRAAAASTVASHRIVSQDRGWVGFRAA